MLCGVKGKSKSVLIIFKEGEIFPNPHQAQTLSSGYKLEYTAHTLCTVASISNTLFEKQLLQNPTDIVRLLQRIEEINTLLFDRVTTMGHKDVLHRLVGRLMYLGQRFGRANKREVIVDIPLTHSEIALSIGTTRETVNKFMSKLQSKKLISFKQQILTIHSLDNLKKEGLKTI